MSYVKFRLVNVARLDTMAALAAGAAFGGFHTVPIMAGLYLIVNSVSNNRYVGKAGNLQARFDSRMLTVNELGLRRAPELQGIDAFYGPCLAYNTSPYYAPAPPVNGPGAAPPRVAGPACPVPTYAAPTVTTTIDGVAGVNVEALLVRYWMQVGLVGGGTMTNLAYTGPWTNPTANQMDVMVEWCAGIMTPIPAAHFEIQIPAGGVF